MKKIFLLGLSIIVLVIGGCRIIPIKSFLSIGMTHSFEQRLEKYIEGNFSSGYYCDILSGHKYFFDVSSFPYQNSGEYLVVFNIGGYVLTKLGNITNCGGGGEILIVHDDGSAISLVHKFDDLEREKNMPNDILKLLNDNPLPTTAYEQAKVYFNVDETKIIDQRCPPYLCNKMRYSVIETGNEDINHDISVYSTIPPVESISGRWTMSFSGDHTMIETDRSCSNDGRCTNTGMWKMINNDTVSYPLVGDPSRMSRFEIVQITDQVLKIRYVYE